MAFASRPVRAETALTAIGRLPSGAGTAQEVVEEIVRRAVHVIGADVFFAAAIDPHIGVCLGPGVHNLTPDACAALGENEFLVPDYNKFADLTPARPVGDLREATGGKLSRSARYRTLNEVAGLGEELRAALPAGGRSWGTLALSRHRGGGPFTDEDRAFLATAAPLAGAVLRRAILDEPHRSLPAHGPGIIVVNQAGEKLSATAEAEAWLQELAPGHTGSASTGIRPELLLMPLIVSGPPGALPQRTRLRTPGGTWLVAHASRLGDSGNLGIVIESAKASEIAPVIIDALGLTSREIQVARLVARGNTTEEIAAALLVSQHTVRGHLKAIFEKTGASTRGELTFKLFAEHYHGPLTDAIYTPADHVAASVALADETS